MARYDARDSKNLNAALAEIGDTKTVSRVLETIPALTPDEKALVVEQALVLFDQLNVHMPLKRARHAIDPVQRLRLLESKVDTIGEIPFHHELIRIFKSLRDAHTNYGLPRPMRGSIVFLPFIMESFFEKGERRFLVTRTLLGFSHGRFRRGVEVTHWNGTPIERAVAINADKENGSNEAARFAFGLADMTVRPLSENLPPDEEWITVSFVDGSGAHEIVLPWYVWDTVEDPPPNLGEKVPDPAAAMCQEQLEYSANERALETHRARKHLFAPDAVSTAQRIAPVTRAVREADRELGDLDLADIDITQVDLEGESTLPNVFQFSSYEAGGKRYGYLRIRTFSHAPIPQFINEYLRILTMMPGDGLIVDVRSNGGGYVINGEAILQTLTHRTIETEPFQFLNTPLTRAICTPADGDVDEAVANRRAEMAAKWGESIAQSLETGAVYSNGAKITPNYLANILGQWYHGPVTLITDANSFSTTDLFAAGFKDHEIGTIIGVDTNTAAGGANVWDHQRDLLPMLPEASTPFRPLPREIAMRVSIRRSLRVGARAGQPLEELGVQPDILHEMTRRDLMEGNVDLIQRAVSHLSEQVVRRLDTRLGASDGSTQTLDVLTTNLDRVDVYVSERPMLSRDVEDGTTTLEVPLEGDAPEFIVLRGYLEGTLVANRKVSLTP